MERVLVVGAGFMGGGIAQVCAQSGRRVHLMDLSSEALDKAHRGMEFSLGKLAAKNLISDTPGQVLTRLSFERDLTAAAQADWIIEAAPEQDSLKLEIMAELDRRAPTETPIASNTSSIPIGRLAGATHNPARVLGLHFFGPVPLMGLVEVIKGPSTAEEIFQRGLAFIGSLNKTPVKVVKDVPGFVMNRIFVAALAEAVDLVAAGVATPQDIDTGMRLGYGWNTGPFEIADLAGLDTWVLIEDFLASMHEDRLVSRSDLLQRMVREGNRGRKSGKGFYRYTSEGKRYPE